MNRLALILLCLVGCEGDCRSVVAARRASGAMLCVSDGDSALCVKGQTTSLCNFDSHVASFVAHCVPVASTPAEFAP